MSKKDDDKPQAAPEPPPRPQVTAREMYDKMREESDRLRSNGPGGGAYGGLEGGAHLTRDDSPGAVRHPSNPHTYANLENGYTPVAPGQSRTTGPASFDGENPTMIGGRVNDPYAVDSRPPDAWEIAAMLAEEEESQAKKPTFSFVDPLAEAYATARDVPVSPPNRTVPASTPPSAPAAPSAPAPVEQQVYAPPLPLSQQPFQQAAQQPVQHPVSQPAPQMPVLPPPGPPVPPPPAPAIVPGWYPVEGGLRWHDGTRWTEHTHPLPPPPVGT